VSVNTSDFDYVQLGDEVAVTGWYNEEQKPSFENSTPGYAVGQNISVTLGKPLTSTKKTHPVATKAGKSSAKQPAAAPAAAPAATTRNPFDN
jgi:hypothetical protein